MQLSCGRRDLDPQWAAGLSEPCKSMLDVAWQSWNKICCNKATIYFSSELEDKFAIIARQLVEIAVGL